MLTIRRFTVESLVRGCVTDNPRPRFSFSTDTDRPGDRLTAATLRVGDWQADALDQIAIPYGGAPLKPFTAYTAVLELTAQSGDTARGELHFETGRLDTPWQAVWISDPDYRFTEKKVSPEPMCFRRVFTPGKTVTRARIYATALGVYELELNGKKVGDRYFAPGFTSYRSQLPYQCYEITDALAGQNELLVHVGGGWAVGSYLYTRKNRHDGDRQALLLELRLEYADGTAEILGTDAQWTVSREGPFRMADLYDGETYDARVEPAKLRWRQAAPEKLRISPRLIADYGAPVKAHERFAPVQWHKDPDGLWICDFGQNLAGVVELTIDGRAGQTITLRHAEILNPDGSLNRAFLRTAKATATYICKDGVQTYHPRMSYMGFRYVSLEGAEPEQIQLTAVALYSDLPAVGGFACSNEMVNRLQSNILWGAKSNLVDIPTDCPQRDERLGWTGDIAVFSPTACFNFDMSRFFDKWLRDVRAEQGPGGGIPNVVPAQGFGFPTTMPLMAIDWWGDACVLVPWAEYRARGDRSVLTQNYETMKRYVKACAFWARLGSFGKHRYLWNTPATLHFGDWVTPDLPQMKQWQARAKWTATASLCNTAGILSQVASILGKEADAARYKALSERVADAYISILTDGKGRLLEEFQTAYVLPLHVGMFPDRATQKAAADRLCKLAADQDWRIGTGFPGTPYILFALADNGHADGAYQMLLCDRCPSWLYEVRQGATTVWERWDALDENGLCPIGDDGTDVMISYNHYASGAVGDFLYRRVAGLEALAPGYRRFVVRPVPGGGLQWAKAHTETPFGLLSASWQIQNGTFTLTVHAPMGAEGQAVLPDGSEHPCLCGENTFTCRLTKEMRL